jgi:hypothetical protein
MTSKHRILILSVLTSLALAATISAAMQLLLQEGNVQGKPILNQGQLTAFSNDKPF